MLQPAQAEPAARRCPPTVTLACATLIAGLVVSGLLVGRATPALDPADQQAQIDLPEPSELATPSALTPPPVAERPRSGRDARPGDHVAMPRITCGHAASECVQWAHRYPSQDPNRSRPVLLLADRQLVLVLDGSRLQALGWRDGELRWQARLLTLGPPDAWRELMPVPEHDLLLVLDGLSTVQAFDLRSGAPLWQRYDLRAEGTDSEPVRAWPQGDVLRLAVTSVDRDEAVTRILTVDPRSGEPALPDDEVTAAAGDATGEVVLRDGLLRYKPLTGGGPAWEVAVPPVDGHPVWLWMDARIVELGYDHGHLWLDRSDGTERVELMVDGPQPPPVDDGQLRWWYRHGDREVAVRRNPEDRTTSTLLIFDGGELVLERVLPSPFRECCVEVVGNVVVVWYQAQGGVRIEFVDIATGGVRTLYLLGEHAHVPWMPDGAPTFIMVQGRQGTTTVRLPSGNVWWRTDNAAVWPLDESGQLLGWPGGLLRLAGPP